jgi:hypothetical protein
MDPKKEAIALAVSKLFNSKHFSVCDVENIAKLSKNVIDKEKHDIMHTIHCVNYSEMTQEFRKWLFETVLYFASNDDITFNASDFNMKQAGEFISPQDKKKPTINSMLLR